MTSRKALFVSVEETTFIRQDISILDEQFDLHKLILGADRVKGIRMVSAQLRLLIWLLVNAPRAEFIVTWFADYHTVLPVLLGKVFRCNTFVIVGGYDAANLPEFDYGAFARPVRGAAARWSIKNATAILPLSNYLVRKLTDNGIDIHDEHIRVIPLGAREDLFRMSNDPQQRRNAAICVSGGSTIDRMKIKGVDFFAETALKIPSVEFHVVGVRGEAATWLKNRAAPNVIIHEWLDRSALAKLLNECKVICQFSRHEGFGLALVEGMLCGCIPVTVRSIGPAEIVDETCGFLIDQYDSTTAASAISEAITSYDSMYQQAVVRAQSTFLQNHRAERLLGAIDFYRVSDSSAISASTPR